MSSVAPCVTATKNTSLIVHRELDVKDWLLRPPSVEAARPGACPTCDAAGRPVGGRVGLHGHGLRGRQVRGPIAVEARSTEAVLACRRYRCTACGAVVTVVPRGLEPRRHYGRAAICFALALWALAGGPSGRCGAGSAPGRTRRRRAGARCGGRRPRRRRGVGATADAGAELGAGLRGRCRARLSDGHRARPRRGWLPTTLGSVRSPDAMGRRGRRRRVLPRPTPEPRHARASATTRPRRGGRLVPRRDHRRPGPPPRPRPRRPCRRAPRAGRPRVPAAGPQGDEALQRVDAGALALRLPRRRARRAPLPCSLRSGRGRALTPALREFLLDIRREYPTASAPVTLRTLVADGRLKAGLVSPTMLTRLYRGRPRARHPARRSYTSADARSRHLLRWPSRACLARGGGRDGHHRLAAPRLPTRWPSFTRPRCSSSGPLRNTHSGPVPVRV